jgi:RimJ/RimL family protein N-acetyltransferase
MLNILSSERLQLIVCTPAIYRATLAGEEALTAHLNLAVAPNWSHFGPASFRYAYREVLKKPEAIKWWSYLFVYEAEELVVGSGGYKGPPNQYGEVEIGYEIADDYQNRGLATEAARALIEFAFESPKVQKVKAHTLAGESPSVHVLKKCGMRFIHTLYDPDDGDLWLWEVERKSE